jgi:hypothetical protein
MNLLNESLLNLHLGPASAFDNLAVVPLLARTDASADYLTLEAALADGTARVMEGTAAEAGGLQRPSLLLGPGDRARVSHLPSLARPAQPQQFDVFDANEYRLGQFARVFHALPRQVGGVFVINDEPVGLEVFDAPETFAAVFPQLVRSYALDALTLPQGGHRRPTIRCAEAFVTQVVIAAAEQRTAATRRHASVGAPGLRQQDVVGLQSRRITGGALVARDRVVHLAAFHRHPEGNPFDPLH